MDPLPLSLLNDYLFCQRRAALKEIEGERSENAHTAIGDVVHQHADLAGYDIDRGVTLWRALPVWSDRLGLNGKCDIVERRPNGTLLPVEYKKGKRRTFDNDDAQLCAQALCLEEMFDCEIAFGAVFHAASKRRREVLFTAELRTSTVQAIQDLHALIESGHVPAAALKPACQGCSLYHVCLPEITYRAEAIRSLTEKLFQI